MDNITGNMQNIGHTSDGMPDLGYATAIDYSMHGTHNSALPVTSSGQGIGVCSYDAGYLDYTSSTEHFTDHTGEYYMCQAREF